MHAYSIPGVKALNELEALGACGLRPVTELNVKSRKREFVEGRQLYMYYLIKIFGWKQSRAAALFGRDHATVIHAVKSITNLRETDKGFLLRMRKIEVKFDNQYKGNMNYKEYFMLEKAINKQGFEVERKELIGSFTKNRKESLRALTSAEYIDFIAWLKKTFKLENRSHWPNTPGNRMRQKLWGLFVIKMGYSPITYKNWLVKYGKFHKPIEEHNYKELTQVVTQAELVYKSFLGEIKK